MQLTGEGFLIPGGDGGDDLRERALGATRLPCGCQLETDQYSLNLQVKKTNLTDGLVPNRLRASKKALPAIRRTHLVRRL